MYKVCLEDTVPLEDRVRLEDMISFPKFRSVPKLFILLKFKNVEIVEVSEKIRRRLVVKVKKINR